MPNIGLNAVNSEKVMLSRNSASECACLDRVSQRRSRAVSFQGTLDIAIIVLHRLNQSRL